MTNASKANGKVDLTLIKRLVNELEQTLATAESLLVSSDKNDYTIEMSKAAGIASGIMTEGGLLIGDIQAIVHGSSATKSPQDLMEKLMGSLKGPGSAN